MPAFGYKTRGNEAHLERNGFTSKIHFRRRPGVGLTPSQRKANRARAQVRSAVEMVFAAQKHRFGLFVRTIIRHDAPGTCLVWLFCLRSCPMVSPSGTRGYREHEGAGRPSIDIGLRARTRYMATPCDPPGCAVSADQ